MVWLDIYFSVWNSSQTSVCLEVVPFLVGIYSELDSSCIPDDRSLKEFPVEVVPALRVHQLQEGQLVPGVSLEQGLERQVGLASRQVAAERVAEAMYLVQASQVHAVELAAGTLGEKKIIVHIAVRTSQYCFSLLIA